MTDKEKELWLSVQYPITIIHDRYDGTYSGASWLAFPLDYDKIPEDVDGDDMLCSQFWKNYKEPVGKGGCAEEAIDNLLLEMELTESEDERIRKELISQVEKSGHHPSDKARWIAWLEKQKEQKPVEWSEEDEKMRARIMMFLAGFMGNEDMIDWLKSLRPQPKVEWNKQDVDMINWLIRCCEKEHEELCNDKYGHQDIISDLKRDCRKKWDWLESLKNKVVPQPQWKPSEEQMKALNRAIHKADKGSDAETWLIDLKEQLKKL